MQQHLQAGAEGGGGAGVSEGMVVAAVTHICGGQGGWMGEALTTEGSRARLHVQGFSLGKAG